jgi:hypothetical protein
MCCISRCFGKAHLSRRLGEKVYSRKHCSCNTENTVEIIRTSNVRQVAKKEPRTLSGFTARAFDYPVRSAADTEGLTSGFHGILDTM